MFISPFHISVSVLMVVHVSLFRHKSDKNEMYSTLEYAFFAVCISLSLDVYLLILQM